VKVDAAVLSAIKDLKQQGYRIALDGFTVNDSRESMVEIADIIKVDFRTVPSAECAPLLQKYAPQIQMLAEKVETREEFVAAYEMGFLLFQGYFFQHPVVLTVREIPPSQISCLQLLQAIHRPELDLREVEGLIKHDASLCYRLLRYLNSPLFGLNSDVRSVLHALSMLGEREIRRWVTLVATVSAGEGKCSELVVSALVRARFCELLSGKLNKVEHNLFLMGLLSLMDAILEVPMTDVLDRVPVDFEMKQVLLSRPGKLRPIYQLMLAQESGEWQASTELAAHLGLSDAEVSEFYWQAVEWSRQVNAA
jgi:EAL and modified HD-GYP domain-containing signal transduction protein